MVSVLSLCSSESTDSCLIVDVTSVVRKVVVIQWGCLSDTNWLVEGLADVAGCSSGNYSIEASAVSASSMAQGGTGG